MRYETRQDNNGTYYINRYHNDTKGMTCRETLYSDMLEHEAEELCAMLNKNRTFLHDLPEGVTLENIME